MVLARDVQEHSYRASRPALTMLLSRSRSFSVTRASTRAKEMLVTVEGAAEVDGSVASASALRAKGTGLQSG